MSTLLILRGPPATGKTTYRNSLVTDGWAYVNMDELRAANPNAKEHQIHDLQRMQILGFMADGKSIVIDNLNLNPKQTHKYECWAADHGYEVQYKDFGTDLHWSIAVERDAQRIGNARVGRSVIIQNYMRAGLYNDAQHGAFIFDIDGTLADITHRKHYLEGDKKDWRGFFSEIHNDTPRTSVAGLYHLVRIGAEQFNKISPITKLYPILVSGRGAEYRKETEAWLEKHNITDYFALFMRGFNDRRPDYEVKKEIYDTYIKPYFATMFVVDDRPQVIRMWRNEGLTVFDCGDGVEF